MNRLLTSRLCSHSEIRQVQVSHLADAAAVAVDLVVARRWRRILATLGTPIVATAQRAAFRELLAVLPAAKASVADSLHRIAKWGHTSARRNLGTTLPVRYLQAVAAQSVDVAEDDTTAAPRQPGILEIILRSIDGGDAGEAELSMSPLRLLAGPVDGVKESYLDFLFPPPPRHVVNDIVYARVNGRTWEERLDGATRTSATPSQLADVVAQGVAQGKSHRDIAKDLLPVVDGVRSSARRIARTEALRVAGAVQERAWDGLGDMMIGLQIRAVLDERTRPEHRLRNGTVYYRDPKPGRPGLAECPHPPLEADGSYAWNCRCHTAPMLTQPDYLDDAAKKLFADYADSQTDPVTYADWFATADRRSRVAAVGVRRYNAARDALGGAEPSYHHFVDPAAPDGLLSVDQIRGETPSERATRSVAVASLIGERRQLIRRAATLGLA